MTDEKKGFADRLNVKAAIETLNDMDAGLWTRGGSTERELVEAIVEAALFGKRLDD